MLECAGLGDEKTDYLIDVWTLEDGLPSSSVTTIAQTRDGYLWIGTYNGLVRFDGVQFVTFDPANTPALRHARVRRLYIDGTGTLWINTYDGSLTAYRDRQFTLEFEGSGGADSTATLIGTNNKPVFLLYSGELFRWLGSSNWQVIKPPGAGSRVIAIEGPDGRIWYRNTNQALLWIEGTQIKPAPPLPLKGNRINVLVRGQRNQIWLGTECEFGVWQDGEYRDMTPTNGENEVNVLYLKPTEDGVWVLANGRLRKAQDKQWVYEALPCRDVFTGAVDRLGIVQDHRNGTWVYHYGKGLFHIRADGLCRKLELEEEFPGERVDSFFCDREGNLWAGVDRGGLVRIRERVFEVLAPGTRPAARSVVSIAEDSHGNLWVGTYGAGLYKWSDSRWQRIPLPWGERGGFVFSVCPDSSGRIWVSAGEEDLIILTNNRALTAPNWPHGVKAILAARDGRVWIGTKNELICWSNGTFKSYRTEEGVRRVDFRALAEDRLGNIWAGTGDGTLYKLGPNSVETFTPPDQILTPIWSLYVDENTVWAGTFRGGLLVYRKGYFTRITKVHGLPNDVIAQILEDDNGNMWFGSHQGIFFAPKAQLLAVADGLTNSIACISYGKYDGLPSLECSSGYQPAACKTSAGLLMFTTRNGIICIDPRRLSQNRTPPPVVIESVKADGVDLEITCVKMTSSGSTYSNHTCVSEYRVKVPPGTRQIEFHYNGLSLVSPDRVRFKYRLIGLDQQWVDAGNRRFAQYSYVRPGKYRFEVMACNNHGVWSLTPTSLLVHVHPRFYQTSWFIGATVLVLVGSIAGIARHLSIRKMRKTLDLLERQRELERDRRRIANDIHDELGAGLTHMTLLCELARRSPPETTSDYLVQISQKARELTSAMDEIVWAVSPQNDTLESLLSYLTKFAMDFLKSAGIRCRIDAPIQVQPYALVAETRHNLFLAVKEALTNVIKHAHATEVQISFSITPQSLTITIKDNGQGLRNQSQHAEGRILSGHGIKSMENRLRECGGTFSIESKPHEGTTVTLCIPLKEKLNTYHE